MTSELAALIDVLKSKEEAPAAEFVHYQALLALVPQAAHRTLTDAERATALRRIGRAVLMQTREALPRYPDRPRKLVKPKDLAERAHTQVMAMGELLGLTDDADRAVFELRCSEDDLARLAQEAAKPGFGRKLQRQMRAAYWLGLTRPESGKRAERSAGVVFLLTIERFIASDAGRTFLADLYQPVALNTGKSPTGRVVKGFSQKVAAAVRAHWIQIAIGCLYTLATLSAILAPTTVREPWASIDALLLYRAPMIAAVTVWCLLWAMGLIALSQCKSSRPFRLIVALLLVVACTQSAGHLAVYYLDTKDARAYQDRVREGVSIISEDFEGSQTCPKSVPILELAAPTLTSCEFDDGVLHARQINPYAPNIGVYSPSDVELNISRFDFYAETRFRAIGTTQIAACGIAIQTYPWAYLMLHLRLAPMPGASGGYIAEAQLILPAVSDKPNSVIMPISVDVINTGPPRHLPFVLRAAMPGSGYSSWTKLAVAVHGLRTYFFVNDRLTLSVAQFPIFSNIGPAVNTQDIGNSSGAAACDFDYFFVQQLPR
ncbi:hypothetical protein EV186_104366 [Labedaea rhizosphaerae]|uniref:Uncharacterized protein n=2 Tax=Labedaea rhizosphaerae TaxID=598644 RepID=A0A4R6S998_LABRH|nr:hypothetical protein EV186_104366 [Labedaea rhizosphaerae]